MSTFKVTVKVDEVKALADRLDRVAQRSELTTAAIDSVNAVVTRADASIRAGENTDLALSDAYVKSKTDLRLAQRTPRAEMVTRGDLTILTRYPYMQRSQPARGPAKGDPSRGIPAGSKQAGVDVAIKRTAPTYQSRWFTMRLRNGGGKNVGVFVRTGKGSLSHIYGPSPYSLARYQIGVQAEDIAADLERTAGDNMEARVRAALK